MAGVSVKMGVTGVAQFKQGMKESQAAVKALDQALKLNEAQLKLNGNEELVLQNRTKILTDQIEAQKNVVRQAESALQAMVNNGVSRSSTAFQQMQANVYKASTDLLNMQAELDGVGEAGEEAQSGVSHMNQALQRIGTNVSFESVSEGIEKITDGLEKAAKSAWNLGKKIVQYTLSGASWADELQTEADAWEIPAEQLYRMQETARIIDTDAETILQAQDKLKKGREEADKGFMGSLAYLNIDPNGKSDIDLFWEAGEAIAALGKESDKVHYAQELFGKSWRDLIPLFKAGREEYKRVYDTWDWVGNEQLEKLTTLDDKYQELQSEWESVQRQFQAQMAEVMTPVMETLTGLLKEFNTYLQSDDGQNMLSSLGEAISGLFEDITRINPAEVIGKITDAVNALKEGFNWIKDNRGFVVDAIKAIGIAFGGLKLAGLAASIGRIVIGLKGLGIGGGGNSGTPTTTGADAGQGTGTGVAAGNPGFWGAAAQTVVSWLQKISTFDPTGSLALLPQVIADRTTFGQTLVHGGTIGEAAGNSWETIKASAEEGLKNFTDYFTKDLPDAFWGMFGVDDSGDLGQKVDEIRNNVEKQAESLQRDMFGPGEQHEYQLTEESLAKAAIKLAVSSGEMVPPMDRMTEVAGEMTATITPMTKSSEDMTAAATAMLDLPALIQTAVINGMSSVSITIDASGIDAMQPRIAGGIFDHVIQMTK